MVWGQSNGVLREIYTGLAGNSLASLTNDTSFPNSPTSTDVLTNGFATPYNMADHYGQRLRALIVPPVTGTYVFWIAANWSGAIYLSTDESPFNKTQIAYQPTGVCNECWYNYPAQQSSGIVLQGGRRYYIEALHAAGNGNDSLGVAWKLPDGTLEQPIPTNRVYVYGLPATTPPAIASQPVSVTVAENSSVSFGIGVTNYDAVSYQWQRNGANVPAALGETYTLLLAGTNDDGARFHCMVSNRLGTITSADAVLTVTADTTPPRLASVANLTSNTIQVVFSEPVDPASATNGLNFSLSGGVSINGATIGASTRIINLATSPLMFGSNYILTVNNVRDRAAARNTIIPNSQMTFPALLKGIYREVFTNIPGPYISDLTSSPAFPNNPSSANLITDVLEPPDAGVNNYGQRLRARLIPPVTGTYTFWIAASDTGSLLLGTNEQPASARQIAFVAAAPSVSMRQWDAQANQKSAAIPLVGGQLYYLEALMKDGVSVYAPAEHLTVRWQLPDGSFEEPMPATRFTPYGMNSPIITGQPTNFVAAEAMAATFAVTVSNVDPLNYQWQRNGTNIPAATNAVYTMPLVRLTDNGSTFQCSLWNVMGFTNTVSVSLSVMPDITPPAIANVVNNSSNRVVVYFSEPVDLVSAVSPLNYSIGGVGLVAVAVGSDARSVILTTTPLMTGSNYTLTVNGVRDLAAIPNTIVTNSQWTFVVMDFFPQDIGSPPLAGSLTVTANGVNIVASGSGSAGTNDQFNFSYQSRRGDFDLKVRVKHLDFADPWTTAGLMAREDLSTNSRFAGVFSTPSISGTFFQYRTDVGSNAQVSGSFPVNYPYTWLRLQRLGGNRFNGYASYDGHTWTQLGTAYLTLPPTIYLGFAVSSHNPSQSTIAKFRDLSDASEDTVGLLPVPIEPPGPCSRNTGLAITEIMYHPAPRSDGRDLEFIELFNSNPFYEDISGYRIAGDVDYTFPRGTVLPGGAFLVIAHNPTDIQAVYGIANVTGPYSKRLNRGAGLLRLRNPVDAVFLEVNYDSQPPWPVATDGAGHSLVLARPSYGEGDVRAWGQSDEIGGSPGRVDGISWDPLRSVVINEFLANSAWPEVDYIELYNHSTVPVDLSGCWLSDSPNLNKFRIPDGTLIGPTGFVYFTEANFNPTPGTNNSFALSSGGEAIYLSNSNQTRVVDSIQFEGQELGVSTGRVPDGGPAWHRLAAKTLGAPNGPIRVKNIVINELMYSPISGDDNDQYVELYNRSTNTINLGNWQFTSGISYVFPSNTLLLPNGYLVVAKCAAQLMTNYPNLNTNNTLGNFSGTLSHGGERIVLSMPAYEVKTNLNGTVTTNTIYIPVDEVTYANGGRWGNWSDAGGSSLELIDPHSDNRLPSNWADSDETAKSVWSTISYTGILDNANPRSTGWWNALEVMLLEGPSECLLDNVSVSIAGSTNLVLNPTFESGLKPWIPLGDHGDSYWANTGDASAHSLHIVATDRGEETANYILNVFNVPYTTGVTGTISARVKWLHGWPEILLRLRGGHLEATGPLVVPRNLGTPGARNSQYVTNAGPAIYGVTHTPVAPAANEPVVVTARVQDPDGVASVQLVYRIDPYGQPVTVPMADDGTGGDAMPGDGIYSATIPAQPSDTLIAFYIQASDNFVVPVTTRFPQDAPVHECLVRFGDPQPILTYGTYHMWMTGANMNRWVSFGIESNEPYDATFAYGNSRVIYNAAAHYGSSPAHRQYFDTPTGTNCAYKLILPADEPVLNDNGGRLEQPGNGGKDPSCLLEPIAYRVGEQLGLPYNYFRSVNLFVNGVRRGIISADVTRESHGWDKVWYPNSDPGDLYKIGYWYEFDDTGTQYHDVAPSLLPVLTTNLTTHQPIKKLDPYRLWFRKRAVQDSANNYTNLFNLVDAVNTTATGEAYVTQVSPVVDMWEWARSWATERIDNNSDLYGNVKIHKDDKPGTQNCYIFKPAGDSWKFLLWDVQLSFAGTPTDDLFTFSDPPMTNLFSQPLMLRLYWQALEDGANGPLVPANMFPWIDARYNAFQLAGINTGSPQYFKDFLSVRRDLILSLLAGVRTDFAITSGGGNSFTNPTTLVTLSGTAPISARTITINGVAYPLSWTSITNWSVRLALSGQTNVFTMQGYDAQGNALGNATKSITIYFNSPVARPQDSLVINEIMYHPAVSNASYVELYNRSTNTTFDLLNYRLQGVDFNFSSGTLIGPQSFLLVVKDPVAFQAAYGASALIAGTYNGNLDPHGEALTLIKQAMTTNEADVVIDKVKFDSSAPWPAKPAVTNSGIALQLIDAAQDNARVSNWDDGYGWRFFSATGQANTTSGSRLYVYLDAAGDMYLDDLRLVLGSVPGAGTNYLRNGDFEASLSSAWSIAGSSGANNSTVTNATAHSGTNSLHLVFTASGSTSKCLYQDVGNLSTSTNYTVSFWYKPTMTANKLTVQLDKSSSPSSSKLTPVLSLHPLVATPGTTNWVAGTVTPYPLLWLNEVQPNNLSGLQDNTGTAQPWIELFNSSTNAIALDGYFLANNYTNLSQWAFPTGTVINPGEFRVIFADGRPQFSTGAVLHTSFRLDPTNGAVALTRGLQLLDYLNYTNMTPGLSYGSYPDGQLFDRQVFYYVTPGASNNPAPVPIAINEWMASNTRTLVDPSTLLYEDWFELYNFGNVPINLSGYYLTDKLNNWNQWRVPNGIIMAPHSFLLCWADNDKTNNNTLGNALHTNFQLSKKGNSIGLFSPGGIKVDAVIFGGQFSDVSQGRYADGNVGGAFYFMPNPTPGTNNTITNNLYAPVLAAITNYTLDEGTLLTFTAHATDADVPAQQLAFSLVGLIPDGASISPLTGVFTWTPQESQGGASYDLTVQVTDNGGPPLSDAKTFTVTVNKVNSAPVIGVIPDQVIDPGAFLSVSIPGVDHDLPPQVLTYALLAAPAGAGLDTATGLFTWTPSQAQASSSNRVVVSVTDNASPPLSATQSFSVLVTAGNPCSGYKGDVAPRIGGSGTLTIADWVQVGRFVAGLDVCSNACELAKADCAPPPCGDGRLTISDWVQAGRYAAILDPLVPVCGLSSPAPPPPATQPMMRVQSFGGPKVDEPRAVVITNMVVGHGQTNYLQIELEAQGDENALGFSLSYDTNLLTYLSAKKGSGAIGYDPDQQDNVDATLILNKDYATNGQLGFALALPAGITFYPGSQPMILVRFRAAEGTTPVSTPVALVDKPVVREVSDAFAHDLNANYHDGTVIITSGTACTLATISLVEGSQAKLTLIGTPGSVWDLRRTSDFAHWETVATVTNTTGLVEYTDTLPTGSNQFFYQAVSR